MTHPVSRANLVQYEDEFTGREISSPPACRLDAGSAGLRRRGRGRGRLQQQASAITSSVDALKTSLTALPSSPSATDIATVTKDAASVGTSVKNFVDASDSKCSCPLRKQADHPVRRQVPDPGRRNEMP
jgi:hypothetical protein